jgi:hypothetical protein
MPAVADGAADVRRSTVTERFSVLSDCDRGGKLAGMRLGLCVICLLYASAQLR